MPLIQRTGELRYSLLFAELRFCLLPATAALSLGVQAVLRPRSGLPLGPDANRSETPGLKELRAPCSGSGTQRPYLASFFWCLTPSLESLSALFTKNTYPKSYGTLVCRVQGARQTDECHFWVQFHFALSQCFHTNIQLSSYFKPRRRV